MSADAENRSPPYASYTSFKNFIDHLAGKSLPSRIDKSVMTHLNYGTQQALMGALRYLGLIQDDATPSQILEKLVVANEVDRKSIYRELVKSKYPYLWDDSIDLLRATSAEFMEKIKGQGVTGSTADKAAAFFLALATEASISLSPHLTTRKSTTNGGPRRSKTRGRRGKQEDKAPPPDTSEQDGLKADYITQLLQKFPSFDPAWPDEIKAKWFEGFDNLMKRSERK